MQGVLQSFQPNVSYKMNYDRCRIPGHAAQVPDGFVKYTWDEALTWVACPGILHKSSFV